MLKFNYLSSWSVYLLRDEFETVLHSDDAFAPVAYLNLKRMHLEDKHMKHIQVIACTISILTLLIN